jgi:hypothetical protein
MFQTLETRLGFISEEFGESADELLLKVIN